MKRTASLLLLALFTGLAVRIVLLDRRPAGLTWDEAALGYNAYSLLLTGRDEFGQTAPLIFKSFGDYKPGLYVYFTVLPTAILGLNELSTRLSSAVFGTLIIAGVYLLSRRLFPENRRLALVSLFVCVANPWLVHFSRGAWEANLNLLLLVYGTAAFLSAVKKPAMGKFLISALFFGLTFLTYQSAKLMTPALIVTLLLLYRRNLQLNKLVPAALLFILLALPVVFGFSTQSGRLRVFSVFSYTRSQDYVNTLLMHDNTTQKNWAYYLYHSEALDQLRGVYQRYLNHFSPRFLFTDGDWTNLRHSEFRQGVFYLIDFIPMLIGLIWAYRQRSRSVLLLAVWALVAPLPSALSRDLVSGVRALPLVLPLIIAVSAGISHLLSRRLLRFFFLVPATFIMAYFFEFYFFHAHYYAAKYWTSPYKPAIKVVADRESDYSRVFITDQLGQPYIYVLYYLRYDPILFQRQVVYESNLTGDVGRVTEFGKYIFRPISWPELRGDTDTLIIGDQYELPEQDMNPPNLTRIAEINYPNGAMALRIVGLE